MFSSGFATTAFSGEETIESLRNHGKYQRRMFDQDVQLVRPGGILEYSTCTINPWENEALVCYALGTNKFLSSAPPHPKIGGPSLIGHYEYSDGSIEEWLRPGEETLIQRFDPIILCDSWKNHPPSDATWEFLPDLRLRNSNHPL